MKTYNSTAPLSVKKLVSMLGDPDENVRIFAAFRLGSRGEEAKPAVAALADLLRSRVVTDRRAAAVALAEIGPAAREGAGPLGVALGDADAGVRGFAARALERVGAGDTRPRAA